MARSILEDGLLIISQCKSVTGDVWEAHFGAAAIAGYFLVKENPMPVDTVNRIVAQSGTMLDKHSSRGAAYPMVGIDPGDAEKMILESLEPGIDALHWVGHNVIYAALSLLAIQELGGWGTKEEILGISTLIRSFDKSIPGRSWLGYSVSEVRKLEIDENDHFPAIANAGQLSEFILSELSSFRTIYRAEAHHDLIGHMLPFRCQRILHFGRNLRIFHALHQPVSLQFLKLRAENLVRHRSELSLHFVESDRRLSG